MSIYLLPKTVVYKLDKIRRSFFWQGGGVKKEIPFSQMDQNL
jgi:hypothetical protein